VKKSENLMVFSVVEGSKRGWFWREVLADRIETFYPNFAKFHKNRVFGTFFDVFLTFLALFSCFSHFFGSKFRGFGGRNLRPKPGVGA